MLFFNNKEKLMIPLMRGEDLVDLDIPIAHRTSIMSEVTLRQASGEIVDRRSAILTIAALAQEAGIAIQEDRIDALAGQGAFRSLTARMEK